MDIFQYKSKTSDTVLTMILVFLIGIEIFVNAPMNGYFKYPCFSNNKDSIIVTGIIISIILAIGIGIYFPINWVIALGIIVLYFIWLVFQFRVK